MSFILVFSGKIQKVHYNFEDPRFIIFNINFFFLFSKKVERERGTVMTRVSSDGVKGRVQSGVRELSLLMCAAAAAAAAKSLQLCLTLTYP